LQADKAERILTITDTGIGMTRDELIENLGTIAHSGAREFLKLVEQNQPKELVDVIGRFGVGFYSVFMVAEWVEVISRSYLPTAEAARWYATGADIYEVGAAEKETRGTEIRIKLREDAAEFAEEYRLREIIRRHSDYVPYPIYLGDGAEKINQQRPLWRQQPREVEQGQYRDFYRQFTLDTAEPLAQLHLVTDAPVQIYALLFVPGSAQRGLFSLRREEGLKLYSHHVLIQEYTRELLPEYFRFVQGVVDSEDLPLNVSRESVQSNAVMGRIKKVLTGRLIGMLKEMALKESERYQKFWEAFGGYIKEGVASSPDESERESLFPLLRFRTNRFPEAWSSLAEIVGRMKAGQKALYYLLGEDPHSVAYSPHLDYFRKHGYEVITLTEPIDSFMVLGLNQYEGFPLKNIAAPDLDLPESEEKTKTGEAGESTPATSQETVSLLVERFKTILGERVTEVRSTDRLSGSVARLVDPEGSLGQEMQRVYRLMGREYEVPKKVLEINPNHPVLVGLAELASDSPLVTPIVEQIYESALLVEGLHPEPASMIPRIQAIMEAAVKK
jgi:molecular chaperone HtpG